MLHGATDQHGAFHKFDSVNTEYLTQQFQRRILNSLLSENLIDNATVENMLSWEHSGFNVFV